MKRLSFQNSIRRRGFTLLELLSVMAIIAILTGLAVPLLSSLKKANDLNMTTASITSLLNQARTYALANNTYVFVCFEETDFTIPTTQTQNPGTGRVAVRVFASLDATLNLTVSNLAAINLAQIFNGIDMPSSLTSTTGTLSGRPSATYIVGSTSFPAASTSITSGSFTFSKIIAFDSRGGIHIPTTPPQAGLQYLEIDLQQSNGSSVPTTSKNQTAIQIDGLTGAVTTYRS